MLKLNMPPKSPRIELSNATFAERKCCQVSAYRSETFRHRRPNIISHCENGRTKNPKTCPSPCMMWTPCNTAMPRPTARTTPNRSSDDSGTLAHGRRKNPHWIQWFTPNAPPKVTLPVDQSQNPTTCLIHPLPIRPMMPNGIRIRSAVFTVRLHVMQRTVLLSEFCPSVCPSVRCVY